MEEEERLRSILVKLHTEAAVLDRVVYKNKNQHRRSRYFQFLLKVRRDLKLLHGAGLSEILNALFPIVGGTKPAENALIPSRTKKKSKHSYQERLLGVARLLSQMVEPIMKAAIQISLLLAKSFFTGFSVMVLALLARIRVLVQQILLDVVSVFNKVSELSQRKHAVKLTKDGIEAFREYYPSSKETIFLQCEWKEDKFILIEKTKNSCDDQRQNGNLMPLSPTNASIHYNTVPLFNGDQFTDDPSCSSNAPNPMDRTEEISNEINFVNQENKMVLKSEKVDRKGVAFVSVAKPKLLPCETNRNLSNRRQKLDSNSSDSTGTEDPFGDLFEFGNSDRSVF